MNVIDLVIEQAELSHKKVKGLVRGVDFENWYSIPNGINSNVAWQLGHLIISKPFQLVIAPIARTKEIYDVVPFRDYLKLYGMGTKPAKRLEESPDSEELLKHFNAVQKFCLEKLKHFDVNKLDEPTEVPHPLAKTKYECLMWSFQHEIWHCGRLSMIRRALGKPLDLKS